MFRMVSWLPTALLAGLLILFAGCGQRYTEKGLEFRDWYVVKPVVTGSGSVAYGAIRNKSGAAVTLTGADFACAASTSLHETIVTGDRVRMTPLPAMEIQDGAKLAFEPGHKHVMLGALKPETAETCEATFLFGATTAKFKMPVKPREK
jgi:copper(I)-binding protein